MFVLFTGDLEALWYCEIYPILRQCIFSWLKVSCKTVSTFKIYLYYINIIYNIILLYIYFPISFFLDFILLKVLTNFAEFVINPNIPTTSMINSSGIERGGLSKPFSNGTTRWVKFFHVSAIPGSKEERNALHTRWSVPHCYLLFLHCLSTSVWGIRANLPNTAAETR